MRTLEEVLRKLPDEEYELDDIVKINNCVLADKTKQASNGCYKNVQIQKQVVD